MKRILITGILALGLGGPALAADIPPAPPPPRAPAMYVPAPPPVYNWSGVYFGVNGGYGFGTSNWTNTAVPGGITTGDFNTNGALVGGTVGGNVQWGPVVLGVEGDWDWTSLKGTTTSSNSLGACTSTTLGACETKSNWLATARGRVGYAFDRLLVYGTGGAAFAPVQAGFANGAFESHTQTGWTAGAGIEFAFLPSWTAKAEYLFVDLPNATCTTNCFAGIGGAPIPTSVKFTENVIRAGINFKLGPWW